MVSKIEKQRRKKLQEKPLAKRKEDNCTCGKCNLEKDEFLYHIFSEYIHPVYGKTGYPVYRCHNCGETYTVYLAFA